jgi:hypothetical protein
MLHAIIESTAKLLAAPLSEDGDSYLLDVWVFHSPHDPSEPARRQIVQLFTESGGAGGARLYLSSTIGTYAGQDLAPLLREMVGALHCSLYLSPRGEKGEELLKIAGVMELEGLDPEHLAERVREVALFADRFEATLFGREIDKR